MWGYNFADALEQKVQSPPEPEHGEGLCRVVHLHKDSFDVLIDRTTPWGNPFSHKQGTRARWHVDTRDDAVNDFSRWVRYSDHAEAQWIRAHIHELRGKTLGCWCSPKRCHGMILAQMANGSLFYDQGSFDL